jgi:hypothetical protein
LQRSETLYVERKATMIKCTVWSNPKRAWLTLEKETCPTKSTKKSSMEYRTSTFNNGATSKMIMG